MALVVSIAGEEKPRKSSFRSEKRQWMLRDYLRDDVSSCSSNGFRSFPRRQCCVAVRNIIENRSKPPKGFSRSRSFSSAIQRASSAIIKLLPFKSPMIGDKNRLLSRSFSKKLFKKCFWLKKLSNEGERKVMVKEEECDEIERWISSGVVGSEKYRPLDLSNDTTVTNDSTNSEGKSDSWSDITFSSESLTSENENDVVERREKSPVKVTEKDVSVTAGDDFVVTAANRCVWSNKESGHEQFSPISVLDFPNNSEGSSSPFTSSITHLKGTKEKLMKRLGRFDSLLEMQLEPVNLESLLSTAKMDNLSSKVSIQPCSTPSYVISSESEEDSEDISNEREEDEEVSQTNEVEAKIQHLLDVTRANISVKTTLKLDKIGNLVLVDFFRENIMVKDEYTLLKAATDWLNGHHDKLILGWEVKEKRQAYIRDMEGEGKWTKDTKLDEREVASELEVEVLAHLIEELLVDIC